MVSLTSGHPTGQTSVDTSAEQVAHGWLRNYSAEVTTPDRKSLDVAAALMWPRAPVYVASLPKDTSQKQLEVAVRLQELNLCPVPHIVARNLPNARSFSKAIEEFARLARVDRALVLGGDRDEPAGPFQSALQLIQSGVFEANGIRRLAIACYPEGHPRISDEVLDQALMAKLEAAEKAGFNLRLITQLCFDADPILKLIRRLRERGVSTDVRIGLAGPASTKTLLKYAAICGVGPSLKTLRRQQSMTRNLLSADTPNAIIESLAQAVQDDPGLAITGLHFFTFASLRKTIEWAEKRAMELAPLS